MRTVLVTGCGNFGTDIHSRWWWREHDQESFERLLDVLGLRP
ncbi:hypothetical protein [Nonomuraea maheshkhaliensis]